MKWLRPYRVFALMKSVKFQFHGGQCSWYGSWLGFGLMVSAFLLLSAVMAWQLDRVEPPQWKAVKVIAWALFASQLVNVYLSWRYFFVGPGVGSTLVAALLAVGAWRQNKMAESPKLTL